MFEQEALFPTPKAYQAKKRNLVDKDRWATYKGRRLSCDVCIINLHHGTVDSELTHSTYALRRGDRQYHLCAFHARQIKEGERRLA